MPSIHAEIPPRTMGQGDGMDLVIQLTAKALRDLLNVMFNLDLVATAIELTAATDQQLYQDNNLEGYTATVGDLELRLESGPALSIPHVIIEAPIMLKTSGGEVFEGTAVVPIPIETVAIGDEPSVFLACPEVAREQVTLAYHGPRTQSVLDDLAHRHAWGVVFGLQASGNIDLTPTNAQLHACGLHASQHTLAVSRTQGSYPGHISLRTAFSDHQDLTPDHLKQIIEDLGPILPSGGLVREEAGVIVSRFELIIDPDVTVRHHRLRALVDLTGIVRTEKGDHRLYISAPLAVRAGQLVVDLPSVADSDLRVSPASNWVRERVLANLHTRSVFPVDLGLPPLAGVCGVVAGKQTWIRLFMETPPLSWINRGHLAPQDEIAIAFDRRLVAGLAWDMLAATNPSIHHQHKILLQRWQTGFSLRGITVDAQVKLDSWAEPVHVTGHFGLELQVPAGGGTCKELVVKPELTASPPLTMMILAPFLVTLVSGAVQPLLDVVSSVVTTLVTSISSAIVKGIPEGETGDQSKALGGVLSMSFHGYRPCIERLDVSSSGFEVGGKLVRVTGTVSHPLQLVGRQAEKRRTVRYVLSSGDVLSIPELVVLMEAGLTVDGAHLVHGKTGTWVRSNPDVEETNNLANLPTMG